MYMYMHTDEEKCWKTTDLLRFTVA